MCFLKTKCERRVTTQSILFYLNFQTPSVNGRFITVIKTPTLICMLTKGTWCKIRQRNLIICEQTARCLEVWGKFHISVKHGLLGSWFLQFIKIYLIHECNVSLNDSVMLTFSVHKTYFSLTDTNCVRRRWRVYLTKTASFVLTVRFVIHYRWDKWNTNISFPISISVYRTPQNIAHLLVSNYDRSTYRGTQHSQHIVLFPKNL
jgi:hypothetical protein